MGRMRLSSFRRRRLVVFAISSFEMLFSTSEGESGEEETSWTCWVVLVALSAFSGFSGGAGVVIFGKVLMVFVADGRKMVVTKLL